MGPSTPSAVLLLETENRQAFSLHTTDISTSADTAAIPTGRGATSTRLHADAGALGHQGRKAVVAVPRNSVLGYASIQM
jgi:hypothetical protein